PRFTARVPSRRISFRSLSHDIGRALERFMAGSVGVQRGGSCGASAAGAARCCTVAMLGAVLTSARSSAAQTGADAAPDDRTAAPASSPLTVPRLTTAADVPYPVGGRGAAEVLLELVVD